MPTPFDGKSHDVSLSSALATIFRGKICDTLLRDRGAIRIEKGATIYDATEKGRTFFFIRSIE